MTSHLIKMMNLHSLDDSGIADTEPHHHFLHPDIAVQPVQISEHSDPQTYLRQVRQNVHAEYVAFLRKTQPRVLIIKGRSADGSIRVLLDEKEGKEYEGGDLKSFGRHLFVMHNKLHSTSFGARDDGSVVSCAEGGDWPSELRNSNYTRRRAEDPGAVFDFGYIGDYYREEEACEHHLANPAPPLLIAVADPLLRQHVEYKALAPFDTFNNKGGVPINQQQYDIVDGLQHSIECIQGPPGTGKSTTIFHIITQRLEDGAVALATCVQNKAVDAIAEKLGGRIPFFVFGNDDRLGLIAKQYTIEGQVKRHPDVLAAQAFIGELSKGAKVVNRAVAEVFGTAAWLYSDRRTRRRKDRAAEVYPMSASDCQEKRDAFMANDGWRRLWEAHIKQRHPLLFTLKRKLRAIRIQALGMLQRLEDRLRLEIVADARAILCTVASTGSLMYHEDIEPCVSRITTVIFDEAGTSPESKLPVLLLLPTLEKIIAIGDQKQLSPFTQLDDPTSNQCFAFVEGRCRFGASCKFRHGGGGCLPDGFFQRAEKALVVVPTMTTQYRMHPAICSLVSDLYYGGLLETPGWIAADRRAVDALGVYWHNSFGRESKARSGGPSTQNEDEADDVLDVYRRERARLTARRETGGSIMIITFYKAQQFHLRRLFEDAGFSEGEHLRITTVDQSQGSEADVVILSTVRSNPTRAIGFLKNPNRLNVAISRAREKLVVVGNQRTVGSTPDWARIVAASNAWE